MGHAWCWYLCYEVDPNALVQGANGIVNIYDVAISRFLQEKEISQDSDSSLKWPFQPPLQDSLALALRLTSRLF